MTAALLSGCAGTAKLVDPAYIPTTLEECRERDAALARGNLASVVTKTAAAATDLALAPFVALAEVIAGRTKDAYAHTTGARNAECERIEAAAAAAKGQ